MSATDMNAHSSRSHTVFTTFFEQHGGRAADGGKTPVRFSKCTLIDLAGSEKWKSHHMTKFSAQRIKELTSINQVRMPRHPTPPHSTPPHPTPRHFAPANSLPHHSPTRACIHPPC